jgi:hypothetical protein
VLVDNDGHVLLLVLQRAQGADHPGGLREGHGLQQLPEGIGR